MIYQIEGLRNKIEWDGINPPKVIRLDGKGFMKPYTSPYNPYHIVYSLFDTDNKRIKLSQGRILLMLRTGISLRQCIESRVSVTEDGRPREERPRRKQWSLFTTLAECKETIRIVEDLSNGNPSSFYALMAREKSFLQFVLVKDYRISRLCFDQLYDQALELTEQKLRDFHFREIRKIHYYFIGCIIHLHKNTPRRLQQC